YLQGAANYVDFYTEEGRITVRMKLTEATDLLPDNFVQIHRSYLVNLDKVRKVEHNHVFVGEEQISIGKAYRDGFFQNFSS
ncbi:MAG: LytTR family DNA-binding domain-containing protein, partial [Bacteroidota bacterium]